MKLRRLLLLIRGIVLIAICSCCLLPFAIDWFYPRLGRITDFHLLQNNLVIPTTNLVVQYGTDSSCGAVSLKNQISQSEAPQTLGFSCYNQLEFSVLNHHNQTYLIIKGDQTYLIIKGEVGNNSDPWIFAVYNITGNTVNWLDSVDSCAYPRLDADSLEFETQVHCQSWDEPIKIETIALH